MKNYIKNFGQFQKLNEQEELDRGGLEELATEIETILYDKYGESYFKSDPATEIIVKPDYYTTKEERKEVKNLIVKWNNSGKGLVNLQIEVDIIDRGNGKYQISYIDTFGTDNGNQIERNYGDYYICSAEVRKGENIGAIVNKEAILEIIQELIKHDDLDWSDGNEAPEGSGPYSIPLKSQPDITLVMDAYYD